MFYGVEYDTYYGLIGNKNVVERARVIYNPWRYEEDTRRKST